MLRDATDFKKVIVVTGYTDIRKGIDGLAAMVRLRYGLDTLEEGTIFLFCGRRADRIKGLVYEGDGYLLLYKRLSNGYFHWPRSREEALSITQEEYSRLMEGFAIKSTIKVYHRQEAAAEVSKGA